MVSFNVLGCCCTRDAFNVKMGEEYSVAGYVQRQNPLLLLQSGKPYLDDESIKQFVVFLKENKPAVYKPFVHNFNKRMIKSIANSEGVSNLLTRKGDWIIIDTFYFQSSKMIELVDGSHTQLFSGGYARLIPLLKKSGALPQSIIINKYEATINYPLFVDAFVTFIKDNWGKNVILLNSQPCSRRVSDNMTFVASKRGANYIHGDYVYNLLLKKLNCHTICVPPNAISRDGDPVHYIDTITQFIKESIDAIVLNKGDSYLRGLYDRCLYRLELMESYEYIDESLARFWMPSYFKSKISSAHGTQVLWQLYEQKSPLGYIGLSRSLRTGFGMGRNLVMANNIISALFKSQPIVACNEYFEVQLCLGDSAIKDATAQILPLESQDNYMLYILKANIFLNGYGVNSSVDSVLEYVDRALTISSNAIKHIIPLLYHSNNSNLTAVSASICRKYAEMGNKYAISKLKLFE